MEPKNENLKAKIKTKPIEKVMMMMENGLMWMVRVCG